MPELPELEICRRSLQRWSAGRVLDEVDLVDKAAVRSELTSRPSKAHPDGAAALAPFLGMRAGIPVRHGKRVGWPFESGAALLVHLGMTGKWVRRNPDDERPKFARLGLRFGDDWLWFLDSRRFGCVTPADALTDAVLRGTMGPDALTEEMELATRLKGRRAVKVALMDQTVVAGLGNIHAVEVLWKVGMAPRTPAGAVVDHDVLERVVRQHLRDVIELEDGEEMTYVTEGAENIFSVYGREGEPCSRCGSAIQAEPLGGRTTFWCAGCQVVKPARLASATSPSEAAETTSGRE